MPIRIIAVDLEGTVISSAVKPIPRPGLREFLEFCKAHFEEIVIMSAVPERLFRDVAGELAIQKAVPVWFFDVRYVNWKVPYKDLRKIGHPRLEEVLLLDDNWTVVEPDQMDQYVPLRCWQHPYDLTDNELEDFMSRLVSLLGA